MKEPKNRVWSNGAVIGHFLCMLLTHGSISPHPIWFPKSGAIFERIARSNTPERHWVWPQNNKEMDNKPTMGLSKVNREFPSSIADTSFSIICVQTNTLTTVLSLQPRYQFHPSNIYGPLITTNSNSWEKSGVTPVHHHHKQNPTEIKCFYYRKKQ